MLVLKHALLNVKRHCWQHMLIGSLLLFLIFIALSAGLIFTSTKKFAEGYAQHFTPIVTILPTDLNAAHEEKLTKEEYLKLGQSDSIDQTKVVGNIQVSFEHLKPLDEKGQLQMETFDSAANQMTQEVMGIMQGLDKEGLVQELFQRNQEVFTGTVNLGLNECLISHDLAELNDLQVGDTIQISTTVDGQKEKKRLTIAGTYRSKKRAGTTTTSGWGIFQENDIFTNWDTVEGMKNFQQLGYITASYKFKDVKSSQTFLKKMKSMDSLKNYYLMTNDTNKKLLLSPVNSMKILSGSLFLGSLIFGVVGLALFSARRFKQSQTEIYLLKNAGIANRELIVSRFVELLFVAAMSIVVSFGSVVFAVQTIADWQLNSQKNMIGDFEQISNAMINESLTSINSVPIEINGSALLLLLVITSLFIISIILIDSYKIVKFDPIEFLLERNLDE